MGHVIAFMNNWGMNSFASNDGRSHLLDSNDYH